ncbi:hypothetical protein BD779DRAFT_289073 [Infundibulicybe gibba]|nr:hypothetical protein BD779DRAFT_289073 [Infundibulicybe gibba]
MSFLLVLAHTLITLDVPPERFINTAEYRWPHDALLGSSAGPRTLASGSPRRKVSKSSPTLRCYEICISAVMATRSVGMRIAGLGPQHDHCATLGRGDAPASAGLRCGSGCSYECACVSSLERLGLDFNLF